MRVFQQKANVFRIKNKALTFVGASVFVTGLNGTAKVNLDFIVIEYNFFYQAVDKKLRPSFERLCIKFPHRLFGKNDCQFALFDDRQPFQFFLSCLRFMQPLIGGIGENPLFDGGNEILKGRIHPFFLFQDPVERRGLQGLSFLFPKEFVYDVIQYRRGESAEIILPETSSSRISFRIGDLRQTPCFLPRHL